MSNSQKNFYEKYWIARSMTTCGLNQPIRDLRIPANLLLRATKPQ